VMSKRNAGTARSVLQDVREQVRVVCPCCGASACDFTRKRGSHGGTLTLVKCLHCGAGGPAISAASGIPQWRLYGWPPPDELDVVEHYGRRVLPPQEPPTEAHVSGWHSRLLADDAALDHAEYVRGVLPSTLR